MADLVRILADYLPEFSARHADLLRFIAASAAMFNALHGTGVLRWAWRHFGKLCRWCRRLTRWLQG